MNTWKNLQDIVASIEAIAEPHGVEVISPAFLTDVNTGTQREVDVLIKHKVGLSSVKIVMECRLHKRPQDIQWIEQLISKKESVGADILVAISANGFTGPAKKLAKAKGIQVRTLETLDNSEIENWMHVVIEVKTFVEVIEAGMRIGDDEYNFIFLDDIAAPEYKDETGKVPLDKAFFKSSTTSDEWPINMFTSMARKSLGVPVRDVAPRDGSRIRKRYLFTGTPDVLVPTIQGLIPATEFLVEVEMWAKRQFIIPSTSVYRDEKGDILARRASYNFKGSNGNASYEVQDSGPNSTSKMAMQFHDEESNEVQINLLSQFNNPSSNGNEK